MVLILCAVSISKYPESFGLSATSRKALEATIISGISSDQQKFSVGTKDAKVIFRPIRPTNDSLPAGFIESSKQWAETLAKKKQKIDSIRTQSLVCQDLVDELIRQFTSLYRAYRGTERFNILDLRGYHAVVYRQLELEITDWLVTLLKIKLEVLRKLEVDTIVSMVGDHGSNITSSAVKLLKKGLLRSEGNRAAHPRVSRGDLLEVLEGPSYDGDRQGLEDLLYLVLDHTDNRPTGPGPVHYIPNELVQSLLNE